MSDEDQLRALFGSDSDEEYAPSTGGGGGGEGGGVAEASSAEASQPPAASERDQMRDLFGSDDDDDDDEADEVDAGPSGGARGGEAGRGEGSAGAEGTPAGSPGRRGREPGEAAAGSGSRSRSASPGNAGSADESEGPRPASRAKGPPLELEADLFSVPKNEELALARLGNVLRLEAMPFDAETFARPSEGAEEGGATEVPSAGDGSLDAGSAALETATARWRWEPNAEGTAYVRSSNARLVRWSDGSLQLLLGDEAVDVTEADSSADGTYLFSRRAGLIQGQGALTRRLAFRPASLHGKIHRALAAAAETKGGRVSRVRGTTTVSDPSKLKREREAAVERDIKERERLLEKQARAARRAGGGGGGGGYASYSYASASSYGAGRGGAPAASAPLGYEREYERGAPAAQTLSRAFLEEAEEEAEADLPSDEEVSDGSRGRPYPDLPSREQEEAAARRLQAAKRGAVGKRPRDGDGASAPQGRRRALVDSDSD